MAATTTDLLVEYQEHMQAIQDVSSEVAADEVVRYLSKHHRFELLDTVFTEFVATNVHQGQHYSMTEMLSTPFWHPRYLRFSHSSIPYRATIVSIDGSDGVWLNIKLPNDGFVYKAKEGVELYRHRSAGWIALHERKFKPYLSGILSVLRPTFSQVTAFYNFQEQHFDLKLWPGPDAPANTPRLLVTFERGYPDMDDTATRYSTT